MKKDYYEITLEEDANLVDEVVVVGYGTQKRGNVDGKYCFVKDQGDQYDCELQPGAIFTG